MHVRHTLPHGPNAPCAAREAIEALAAGRMSEGALSELRLVVSELVTNAIRHGLDRRGAVDLALSMRDGVVRVEVIDGGAGFEVPAEPPEPGEPGGWGLVVVDRLASRWGVEGGRATRVWAEVPLDGFGASGGGTTERVYARNV